MLAPALLRVQFYPVSQIANILAVYQSLVIQRPTFCQGWRFSKPIEQASPARPRVASHMLWTRVDSHLLFLRLGGRLGGYEI